MANRLFGESLSTALSRRGWTVVAQAGTPEQALTAIALYQPDVCLLGRRIWEVMQAEPTFAALYDMSRSGTRLVLLGTPAQPPPHSSDGAWAPVTVIGADQAVGVVDEALARVVNGDTVGAHTATIGLRRRGPIPADRQLSVRQRRLGLLTEREHEVLRRMVGGSSTAQIAAELDISVATVRSHVQNIFLKLRVHNRLRAVAVYGPADDVPTTDAG